MSAVSDRLVRLERRLASRTEIRVVPAPWLRALQERAASAYTKNPHADASENPA